MNLVLAIPRYVAGKLMDFLFGPEEEFEYKSCTRSYTKEDIERMLEDARRELNG